MSAEQISLINTIAFVLDKIGTWPIGMVVFVAIVGPWVGMFILNRSQEKRFETVVAGHERRFEKAMRMYENNVSLVKDYSETAKGFKDVVILNTQVMTEMKDAVKNNLFCPLVRKGTQQTEASS